MNSRRSPAKAFLYENLGNNIEPVVHELITITQINSFSSSLKINSTFSTERNLELIFKKLLIGRSWFSMR